MPSRANPELSQLRALAARAAGTFAMLERFSDQATRRPILDWTQRWSIGCETEEEVASKARDLFEGTGSNSYFQDIIATRLDYYGAGFSLWQGSNRAPAATTARWQPLATDVWTEFLLTDSAVVFWAKGIAPTVFNREDVTLKNVMGVETLTVKLKRRALSSAEKQKLTPRLAKAFEEGKLVVTDGEHGEHFRVIRRCKRGAGLGMPRAKAALTDLAIWEILQIGEWNGAWSRRNVIRQAKKGHEIKQGNLAGQPMHFFKSAFGKQLLKQLAGMSGAGDIAGNFDLDFDWVYMPTEFFDPKVFAAVQERLDRWAGGAALAGNPKTTDHGTGLDMLRVEAQAARGLVSGLIEEVIRSDGSDGSDKSDGIAVRFSDGVFFTAKERRAYVSSATASGHMSPQTAREDWHGLSDAAESERMREAATRPEDFTPPFEAKQGMLGDGTEPEGGRPKAET